MILLALIGLGLLAGAYGTLIGAGGGFLLVPTLLLLYPGESPTTITSISLAVVFFNALSGSLAYARQRRIDYASGRLFALATIPGAVIGAIAVGYFSRSAFNLVFAALLIGLAVFLLAHPTPAARDEPKQTASRPGYVTRTLRDAEGDTCTYSYHAGLGLSFSAVTGFVSSLLGIGGGIIHVPVLVNALNFPPHIATATSQFVLAVMALAGTVVHILNGEYQTGWRRTAVLAVAVIVGAQVGARLSQHVRGRLILRLLALGLLAVGLRLAFQA